MTEVPAVRHQRGADTRKPKASWLKKVYQFFSSGLGLAIVGGVLGLIGSALTVWATDYEHRQDQQAAISEQRAQDLASLHGSLGRAIIEREIAADAFLAAVSYGATDEEFKSLWNRYLDSYRVENATAEESQALVTGHPEDDPAPANPTGMEDFWYFLDTVIQSRFDSMHQCLLTVHAAYVDSTGAQADRFRAAMQKLSACETDPGWDKKAYFDPSSKTLVSMAKWADFKTCIEDYVDLEDLNARLQRRVWQSTQSFWDRLRGGGFPAEPNAAECKTEDPVCLQARFLKSLDATLQGSCGKAVRFYDLNN